LNKFDKPDKTSDLSANSPIPNYENVDHEAQEENLISDMEVDIDSNDEESRDDFLNEISSRIKIEF